jgi:predicted RNA-binding Zn-ribbon protein involved in translation (DUF1610 family)
VPSFLIEHQCPQCGAPATLEEADRLLRCGFCRVISYLWTPDFFRYCLPHRAPAGRQIFYFPYWRFKGMHFSCRPRGVEDRFVDISLQALASSFFPLSVGLRSQTQKLHFAAGRRQELFLRPALPFHQGMPLLAEQLPAGPGPVLHQAWIGETLSLLYAPYYLEGGLIDAVVNEPVDGTTIEAVTPLLDTAEKPHWPLSFIPALCPGCGAELAGGRDALVMACGNCRTAWHVPGGRLEQLPTAWEAGQGDGTVYLPFWRIRAGISAVELNSYADLIRAANLPRVVQRAWEQQPLHFWCPAFKVRPRSLLAMANHLTLHQPGGPLEAGQPAGRLHGVTLPPTEAAQTIKLVLAGLLKPRQQRLEELLPIITAQPRSALLVYLPFREASHELVHAGLQLSVNKNLLRYCCNL